ncbi:MAG: hypothetical protein ACI8UO_004959, partial [Verrucomicrobiales bacterium]
MITAFSRALALVSIAAFFGATAHAVPNVVNYQGHLEVDG